MRCKACNAIHSTYRPSLQDYYCSDCAYVIKDTICEDQEQDPEFSDHYFLHTVDGKPMDNY